MKHWWQQQLSQARQQLADNPRLRVGLFAIPLIVLLYFNLVLSDSRAEQVAAIASANQELLDARQLASQHEWLERLDQAREQLEQQRQNKFGKADSEAFARADIQANAKTALEHQNLQKVRIEVSTAGKVDPVSQLIPLQLRLLGSAQGAQLFSLIVELESSTPKYRIDSVNAQSQNGESLAFTLIATVWYSPWGVQ